MKNNNFYYCDDSGYDSGFGYGYGFGYGVGYGYGNGYSENYGFDDDFGYGYGYGDIDSWIKIGQIDNKDIFVLSQWPYMKIGDEIYCYYETSFRK